MSGKAINVTKLALKGHIPIDPLNSQSVAAASQAVEDAIKVLTDAGAVIENKRAEFGRINDPAAA
jgi:hypothetical protein